MINRRKFLSGGAVFLVITIFTIFAAFPFYWMLMTSFRTNNDLYIRSLKSNTLGFNDSPTIDNYTLLFNQTNYGRFVVNSIGIGIAVVLITLIGAVPAAYSLARLTGAWGERLGILIFLVYLIPPTLLFIPLSRMIVLLRLQDTVWALIVTYPTFTIPFCTWLMMGFIKSLPREIEEQAMVDGCSRLGAAVRVVLPLTVPGILTITVFSFTLTMHEYIYALAFVAPSAQKPIGVGVTTELIRGDVYFWQSLMGAAILVAIPVALIYTFFLDRFIAGFTLGAVKG
ncbi:MAG: carbohydrate ABC transporter permease [Anaerolineae bacterium]|nr:carbohydrate ABC transporter permease [Anaerolineae bacterium]